MVGLGVSRWSAQLHDLRFVRYWTACLLLALTALVLALWDMILVRRAFQRRRRELFRRQFTGLTADDRSRTSATHPDDAP